MTDFWAWHWVVDMEKGLYTRVVDISENPQFCLCKRCFVSELPPFGELASLDEIVTLSYCERSLDYETALGLILEKDQQILCEYCLLDENGGELDSPDIAERVVEGFEFCGFEIEGNIGISTLTNCGGAVGYERAFSVHDLNRYGLISDYGRANEIKRMLETEYPDDEHAADCVMFAVWRRISGGVFQ